MVRRPAALAACVLAGIAAAVHRAPGAEAAHKPVIPILFDVEHRAAQPNLAAIKTIRFATTDDFPPFHFALPDGSLSGFDVDLARAICSDLKISCTIQARRFDTLIEEIKTKRDDALIAAVANTQATRADLLFTAPYYTTPGRFVTAVDSPLKLTTPEALASHRVGVVANTAYEAYLKAFYPKLDLRSYHNQPDVRAALQQHEIEAIFADGIGLALWLNGTASKACCAFRGGPYTESHFFGNGVSIAVAKDNVMLRQALDFELAKLTKTGVYADLYLKYFPIGFY